MNAFRQQTKHVGSIALVFAFLAAFAMVSAGGAEAAITCGDGTEGTVPTYTADVVLFDTFMMFNRLGAQNPNWMMYALERDTVDATNEIPCTEAGADCTFLNGTAPNQQRNIKLRPDKRPRPLVLRIPADSCLQVNFTNLLSPDPNPFNPVNPALQNNNQVASRAASFHVAGLQVVNNLADDGTLVGANDETAATENGIVNPGATKTYTLYAEAEGAFLVTSHGATFGGEATGGNIGVGAFGMVAVQPVGAKIYRSQVTEEEFRLADPDGNGIPNYEALYPTNGTTPTVWDLEGKGGKPILNMMDGTAIFHSEINAIVAGPNGANAVDPNFPQSTYPLESKNAQNPSVPNRLEPFRDFASVWHDENAAVQAFPAFFGNPLTNPLAHALHGVRDSFMINYGSGGIGSEIIANRLGVGPMYDCLGCAYEEFFLTSFTVGDPAMIVDVPANVGLENCGWDLAAADCAVADIGRKANKAFFPAEPANVHHSYTGDKAKLRNVHAGPKEQHIFHLHNHQWLFNANDDNSNYLDAQGVGPGSTYTFEINFGGSGNRNKSSGDAIFHCHFYPHFAQGMWYHWRHHDVLETGTYLAVSGGSPAAPAFHTTKWDLRNGTPANNQNIVDAGTTPPDAGFETTTRALPDGEILVGTPIPAVVPLPGKPLPPVPGRVTVVALDVDGDGFGDSSQASVDRTDVDANGDLKNPGFPFWVAGIEEVVGQRPPTPQLEMLTKAEAKGLLGLPGGTVSSDAFYQSFCLGNSCAAGQDFADSFVNAAGGFDGGLPRHALEGCKAIATPVDVNGDGVADYATGCSILDPVLAAQASAIYETSVSKLDMHKEVKRSKAVFYPEEGTEVEKAAMAAHALRNHLGGFVLNGGPPVPGAPYSEPCIDDSGNVFYSGTTGQFFNSTIGGIGGGNFQGSPQTGRSADDPFVYKGANIQIDAVFNKVGYHYPQQRIIALWNDIVPTIDKTKAPEPFVMRLNTFDCAVYRHANLVPKEFEVDDYQVRTPTDIIGQHIHLPKWDLTTADGAANGWNYEDGTLSPGMVVERIHAINDGQGGIPNGTGGFTALLEDYPEDADFPQGEAGPGTPYFPEWDGARVTTQRWFVDPVYNVAGHDRGLGIIFTHDHYGPSSFQQIGLYSTLLVQPAGSIWKHNETGTELATRTDGGPTSWQAAIEPGSGAGAADFEPFREFYFEFSDFQHAYEAGIYVGAGPDGRPFTETTFESPHYADGTNKAFPVTADTFRHAINPSYRQQAAGGPILAEPFFPDNSRAPALCPDGSDRPCPEAISADDPGMLVVNYRNEPVGLRVFDPVKPGADGQNGTQADGRAGDLAFALQTRQDRAIAQMNSQPLAFSSLQVGDPGFYVSTNECGVDCTTTPTVFPDSENQALDTLNAGNVPYNLQGPLSGGDPYTPMLRARAGDTVKIKVQTGAHEHEHSISIHGVKWLQGGSQNGQAPNSGWKNSQGAGISEQFTFIMPVLADNAQRGNEADYAWSVDVSQDGYWSGTWGIMRNYQAPRPQDLYELSGGAAGMRVDNLNAFVGSCPKETDRRGRPTNVIANLRHYEVAAVLANDVLSQTGFATGALIIPDNQPVEVPADSGIFLNNNEGGPLDPNGGTLVHNPRPTALLDRLGLPAGAGPLHDPTAMMYVRLDDLEPRFITGVSPDANIDSIDDRCQEPDGAGGFDTDIALAGCPVQLKAGAPVEPLVLRANADDCVEVTLHNKLIDPAATLLAVTVPDNVAVDDGTPVIEADGTLVFENTGQELFVDLNGNGIGELEACVDGSPPVAGSCSGGTPFSEQVLAAGVAFDRIPDLAGWNTLLQMVIRDRRRDTGQIGDPSVTSFNNNLIRPSAHVGLHPQLVEYDVTRSDGTNVGNNVTQTVAPGGKTTYQWYAGDLRLDIANASRNRAELKATPVEFGGTNLIPADKVKQGQKGLIGALIIEPQGSTWPDALPANLNAPAPGELTDTERDRQTTTATATRYTRADVTVDCDTSDPLCISFEDLVVVVQKGNNHRLGDGTAVPNIASEGIGIPEDSHDAGQKGVNYGSEPAWFRFGLAADNPLGFTGGTANGFGDPTDAWKMYHNSQAGATPEDPATPVYDVVAGAETRMRLLMPTGVGRGSTFTMHGHIWQRDPYVCLNEAGTGLLTTDGLAGKCANVSMDTFAEVGSQRIGDNPIGMWMGGQESVQPYQHFEVRLEDAGGAANAGATPSLTGDFLWRDQASFGNTDGIWGLMRLSAPPAAQGSTSGGGGGGGKKRKR